MLKSVLPGGVGARSTAGALKVLRDSKAGRPTREAGFASPVPLAHHEVIESRRGKFLFPPFSLRSSVTGGLWEER